MQILGSILIKGILGVFLLVSFSSFGQEICDNGIDDDADGLVDLNDVSDCACNNFTMTTNVPSIIPNPSFEQKTGCPNNFSQLFLAADWKDATNGDVDYMNTCGFVSPDPTSQGLVPFPDGNGIVGISINDEIREYVGTCLPSPLKAGIAYTLKFNIASNTISSGAIGPTKIITDYGIYGPIDFTIYGAENCSSLPVNTNKCPLEKDPSWKIIGSATYSPSETWEIITFTFTPTSNINTIMIGAPCVIPSNFPKYQLLNNSVASIAYFYLDNLLLNTSESFNPVSISKQGFYCSNDIVLSATISSGTVVNNPTFQWYKKGVAIVGATQNNYAVPSGVVGLGDYQVRLIDGSSCGVSSVLPLIADQPPLVTITPASTSIPAGSSTSLIATGGETYTWSPISGLSCTDCNNPTASPDQTTNYCVDVVDANKCTNKTCATVKVIIPCGDVFVPTAFSPNGDSHNDRLEVKMKADCIESYNFKVFDRWGEVVFETTKITDSWDGKHNGKDLNTGAFVYYLKIKLVDSTSPIIKKGSLSIIY